MSALFGGIPATAANVKNGGRTPIAGIVHVLTLFLILLFLMPYASLIPMSCLASILIIAAYNMSGWRTFIYMLRKAPKSDIAVLLTTLFLTVFFDLVVAIEFGMILAAFLFLKRMSDVATVHQWVDKNDLENEEFSERYGFKTCPKTYCCLRGIRFFILWRYK
ncbi:Sulfate permease [Lactococcus sp. DD01]|nr:Sulfate permease [Lactococcus sp. DD01]